MRPVVLAAVTTFAITFNAIANTSVAADHDAQAEAAPAISAAPLAIDSQAAFDNLRGRDATRDGPIRIAFLPVAPDFTYYASMREGVEAMADQVDAEAITVGPPGSGDNEVHVALIEQVLSSPSVHGLPDVHGLIVAVRDAELAAPVLRQAVDAGVIVVVANSDLQSFPTPIHAVVGYSQNGANRAMGDYAGRLAAGQAMQVGIIEGAPGYHSTEAVSGFRKGLAEHAQLTVVGSEQGGWSVEGGKSAAETLLREHPGIGLIWAANDNMIMGARLAAHAAGRSDILLLGRDGDPDALQMVAEGDLTATTDTDPAEIGAASVRVIVEALAGRFHGGFVETPTTIVDRDNTSQTLTDR